MIGAPSLDCGFTIHADNKYCNITILITYTIEYTTFVLFDALSFGGGSLEKERAVIRDPKNGFPWISDVIDPT